MSLEDKDKEWLRNEIAKNTSSGRTFQTGETSAIGAAIQSITNVAVGGVRAVAELAEKSMSNTADAGDAVKAVSTIIRQLGEPGRLAGGALDMLGNILEQTLGNWQKFSTEGLNYAGNAVAFRAAVMRTGMSFEEFGESLEKIKPALFQMGIGIAGGLEAFGEISKRMNSPEMQVALNTMGILPKEANEILAMTVRLGRSNISQLDEAGKQKLLDSTLGLAREMDMMAKLTGISRREQQKNIETIENDARVRARMSQLMNDPNKREGIGNIISAGGVLPPEASKALAETIAGAGIMTSEKLSDLNLTYGSKVAQMYIRIGQLSDGTAEEQAEAAKITRELIPAMVEGRRQMAQYVRFGANTSAMGMEAFSQNGAASNYENTVRNEFEKLKKNNPNISIQDAQDEANRRAKAQSEGKLIEDMVVMVKNANGEMEKRTLYATKDAQGNYNQTDPTKIATQMATTVKAVATGVGVEINEGIAKFAGNIIEFVEKDGKLVPTDASVKMIQAANGAANDENNKKQAINIGTAVGQHLTSWIGDNTKALTDLPTKMADAFAIIYHNIAPMAPINPRDRRALGSKGATGDWWEGGPQSILMGEGGENESVVPYSQRGAFIRDNLDSIGLGGAGMNAILRNIPAMVSSGTKNVEQAVSEMASVMPDSNILAEKLDKLSSIMASVERNMAESTSHARETAKNTREIGGIVA